VGGVAIGDTIELHTNAACAALAGQIISTGTSMSVGLTSQLTTAGTYTFYARRTIGGVTSACSASSATYQYSPINVEPVYPTNANWNDYVKYNDTLAGVWFQTDAACDGSETGYYGESLGCVHGGELRKVRVNGYTSCSNLTLIDSNNSFDWECVSNSMTGFTATFFSKKLKPNSGLRDLISSSGNWNTLSVTLKFGGSPIATSSSTQWWSNPIIDLVSNSSYNNTSTASVIDLNLPGTIYFSNSASLKTYGYQIAADKISVVTFGPGLLKKYGPDNNFNCNDTNGGRIGGQTHAILCGGSRKFVWIEASMTGLADETYSAYTGILAKNWKFSRFNNMLLKQFNTNNMFYVFDLISSHNNMISGVDIFDGPSGVDLYFSQKNIFRNLKIAGMNYNAASCRSLNIASGSDHNKFFDLRVTGHLSPYGTSKAINIVGSNNVFSRANISAIAGRGDGIYFGSGASGNILSQVVTSANNDAGLYLAGTVSNNLVSYFVSANSSFNGIHFSSGTYDNNTFLSIVIGNTINAIDTYPGSVFGSNNRFIDLYIANNTEGAQINAAGFGTNSGFSIYGNNTTDCSGLTDLCNGASYTGNLTNGFNGKVNTGDSTNPVDSNGMTSDPATYSGWLHFDNWMRGWGLQGSTFPSSDTRGIGENPGPYGPYQIWDWRQKVSGGLYNKSNNGIGYNGILNSDSLSCAANTVAPLDTVTHNGIEFLRNAIEIDGDGKGNDNTLCQANEDCIWAPHIGAYQGSGPLTSGYCTVEDGGGSGLDGIKIFKHTVH
jgi:hypothetical protein